MIDPYDAGQVKFKAWMAQPNNAHSGQKQPDNFDEILQANAQLGKYLKEKCLSEHFQQLSFKYLVKSFSIPKLLWKVS